MPDDSSIIASMIAAGLFVHNYPMMHDIIKADTVLLYKAYRKKLHWLGNMVKKRL